MSNTESNTESTEKANFETAISATKFGKFNYFLLVCSIPASMTPIIDNTVMSYVIPMAECDLSLSLQQKGMLNSAIFVGFILSSYFWGFLSDNLGRKRMILIAYTLDFIFNFLGAFMQHFWWTYMFKFVAGFIVSGPYALIITYVSELHSSLYRSKVLLLVGLFMTISIILSALLAWVVMPLSDMVIFTYVLHPWQLYLLISCLPTFFSAIVFVFLPESPKFLMTSGRNEEAMKIFKMIYRLNTGKNDETYSIKGLANENISAINNETFSLQYIAKIFTSGFHQMKPLFHKPYLSHIFLSFVIHFGILGGGSTLRLWLPQIFTSIDEYNQLFGTTNGTLCDVIEHSFGDSAVGNSTEIGEQICQVIMPQDQVFINATIVASASVIGYFLLAAIINQVPKKQLLAFMVTVAGCLAFGISWTPSQNLMLIVTTLYITLLNISSTTIFSLVIEVFPTTFRALAVSLTVMAGQLGAFLGSLFFPFLLQAGCLPPFLFLGSIVTFCGLLCLALPNPSGKDFK